MVIHCMDAKPGMEVACLTDVGRQRENNEDSCLYWEPRDEAEFLRKGRLAVIADGMGGYEGGQEASRLAVETVREIYSEAAEADPQPALVKAFASAHQRIQDYAETHPELRGMGTTCTAMVIRGRALHFAHVGDSRLYLIRGFVLSRLTRDHSYVGRLVESGIVRAEDAESHPQRHILTAALGSGNEVAADVSQQAVQLQQSDTLVLCTDGLWGLVNEQEVVNTVNEFGPEKCCRALVDMALKRGGPDNITVQIIRVGAEAA
jgi:serine/threonine protein phosphatase PrpC